MISQSFFSSFTKQQNLRLVQTESISRQQNIYSQKIEIYLRKHIKHCGKKENAGNQHLSFFPPQCFQKLSVLGLSKVGSGFCGKELYKI